MQSVSDITACPYCGVGKRGHALACHVQACSKRDKPMMFARCDACGHVRQRVMRIPFVYGKTLVCRGCAIDRHGVTPEQWSKAWAKRSPNAANPPERGSAIG